MEERQPEELTTRPDYPEKEYTMDNYVNNTGDYKMPIQKINFYTEPEDYAITFRANQLAEDIVLHVPWYDFPKMVEAFNEFLQSKGINSYIETKKK